MLRNEHLKNKEFIEEKEIAQLLGRARNKMNSIDRFNKETAFCLDRHTEHQRCSSGYAPTHLQTFFIG